MERGSEKMEIVSPVAEQLHHHHHHLIMQRTEPKKKPLYLESYLSFLRSRDFSSFTVDHLNLIISIHGFKKLCQKKKAEEAVRTIEPIDPVRSTLNDEIESTMAASMTFNDAMKDLQALNWQECSVTTIRVIKSQNYSIVPVPPSITTVSKSRSRKPTKRRNVASLVSAGSCPSNSDISSDNYNGPLLPLPSITTATAAAAAASTTKVAPLKSRKRSKFASTMSSAGGPSNSSSSGSSSIVAGVGGYGGQGDESFLP